MTKHEWIRFILSDYIDVTKVEDYDLVSFADSHGIRIFNFKSEVSNETTVIIVRSGGWPIGVSDFDCFDKQLKPYKLIEEKDNTIRQLEDKLSQFRVQYQDYKAACTKIIDAQRAENLGLQEKNRILSQLKDVNVKSIQELCRKVLDRDKKIEELSTKLAEVVVERNGLSKQVDFWKDEYVAKCSEYRSLEGKKDELRGQIEDLESTIEGQKEQISGLENSINDILSIPAFKLSYDYKTSMGDILQ